MRFLTTSDTTPIRATFLTLAAALLVYALSIMMTVPAYADVREDDIIIGQTVRERDLTLAQAPNIEAEYACVMDVDGKVYFDRNMNDETNIASVTKIMTALLTLENADIDEQITVSDFAASIDGSSANLHAGDQMNVKTALQALLIPSGNDAALALAEHVGAKCLKDDPDRFVDGEGNRITDPVVAFVKMMNDRAVELGMENTLYANPHGLDDGEWEGDMYSSAYDVALLCREAMKNEVFRESVRSGDTTISVQRGLFPNDVKLESTDRLLGDYEKAIGIKTGFTDLAGNCFAGAASANGVEVYCIALDSASEDSRFLDVFNMSEWFYAHRVTYNLANSSETAMMVKDGEEVDVPVFADVAHEGWVDTTFKAALADTDAQVAVFDFEGNVYQDISLDEINGNVRAGDVIGHVTFKQRDTELVTIDIVACEDQPAPNSFQTIGIFFERMSREANDEPTVAATTILNTMPYIVNRMVAA